VAAARKVFYLASLCYRTERDKDREINILSRQGNACVMKNIGSSQWFMISLEIMMPAVH
jgi:hypothetical protein